MPKSTTNANNLRAAEAVAKDIGRALANRPTTTSVCLLGSVARGDATHWSDLDLLLINRDGRRPTRLLTELAAEASGLPVSVMVRSALHFKRSAEGGTLFALHIRTEARILFDRNAWLANLLTATADVPVDTGWTLAWAERELALYEHLDRFNGIFLHALARLFSLGRAVAIALTALNGKAEFGKDRPFTTLMERYPVHAPELGRLLELRAFHERANGANGVVLPFDHHDAEDAVLQAVSDVRRLIRAA